MIIFFSFFRKFLNNEEQHSFTCLRFSFFFFRFKLMLFRPWNFVLFLQPISWGNENYTGGSCAMGPNYQAKESFQSGLMNEEGEEISCHSKQHCGPTTCWWTPTTGFNMSVISGFNYQSHQDTTHYLDEALARVGWSGTKLLTCNFQ